MRQIPEMSLAAAFLSLLTIPLGDAIGNVQVTLQMTSGLGLLFTIFHIFRLIVRARAQGFSQRTIFNVFAFVIDVLILLAGAVGVATGTSTAYEWLLVFMLARPALAFVFVLSEVTPG